MSKMRSLIFPLVAVIIFTTLMAALLGGPEALPAGQQLPVTMGLLAFSLALTVVFIALRPKPMERRIGLHRMYLIHGTMAIVLFAVVIAHVSGELTAQEDLSVLPATVPLGVVAAVLLVLTTLTGALILSHTFIRRSNTLMRLKESVVKREVGLWVHRLSIVAVVAIFVHMMSVEFVRSNIALSMLSGLYVAVAVGGYVGSKAAKRSLPRYVLRQRSSHNPSVSELELEPQRGTVMTYRPGQYVFVRFIESELPKESHPFSVSSAPVPGSDSLKVLIKNSGDYTSLVNKLNSGDIATLEGPYGNFMDEKTARADMPLVLLAGGIGITPMLSILQSQMERPTSRTMVLVWGAGSQDDLLLLDVLQEMKQKSPHFSYFITLSKEQAGPFDNGRISQEYLRRIGVGALYPEADFFICGPAPMMASMKRILADNNVPPGRIHIEEFSF